jgi:hypothetical protein
MITTQSVRATPQAARIASEPKRREMDQPVAASRHLGCQTPAEIDEEPLPALAGAQQPRAQGKPDAEGFAIRLGGLWQVWCVIRAAPAWVACNCLLGHSPIVQDNRPLNRCEMVCERCGQFLYVFVENLWDRPVTGGKPGGDDGAGVK